MNSLDDEQHTGYDGDVSGSDVEMTEGTFQGKPLKPWSDLPPIVLEKIYSYLSRNDQCRMSQVCSKWSKEFGSPSVWRRIKFYLPDYECNKEMCPEVRFAQKYGHMFRYIEIIYKRVRIHLVAIIWKQLTLFLQSLIFNTQLISISFTNMGNCFRRLEAFMYEDTFRNITDLLAMQSNLKTVEFFNSHFEISEAAKILKAICKNNSGKVRNIILRGFVENSVINEIENNSFVDLSFMYDTLFNVQLVEIEYSQLLEEIIHGFSNHIQSVGLSKERNMKGALTKMKIYCEGSRRFQSRFKGISSSTWKQLRKVFPALQVDICLNAGGHPQSTTEFFIERNIPLRALDFRHGSFYAPDEIDISFLFHHILTCGCNDTLEELSIVWIHTPIDLATDLLPFLLECPRLKVLQLYIGHPVRDLQRIFDAWLQNRPKSLEVVHLTIAHIQDPEEASGLLEIADDYAPLLQVLGLNLFLIAEAEERS